MDTSRKKGNNITHGSFSYLSEKSEDKVFICTCHPEVENMTTISSYGVFDGHYGDVASTTCATHLHPAIIKRYKRMLEKCQWLSTCISRHDIDGSIRAYLSSDVLQDALLVESIRAATQAIDFEIRRNDKSGINTFIEYFDLRL